MDRIVETMRDLNLQESWGEVIDVTEFMTDSTGFFNTNGLGAFTQIYDRADGRFRPVYTNESDLKLIRAMSWLLVEKVPMAQAWVNRLLDYTIGTGFDWTIKAEDKRLEKAVQLYVRETLDNSRWSSELERESYVREVADGEFLSELIYDDGQCLMVAREADELTEPAIKGELEDWIGIDFVPSWTFGVLTKQSLPERPIGYHFVRNSAGTDWDYVPAERVCLWKRNVRSRGKRGFSDFYKPHLYLLRADRVLTNTAEGAATQAAIAYIVEHRDGTQRQADNIVKRFAPPTGKVDPLTGLAQRRRRMLPGTRLDVPEGQQYKAGLLGSNNSDIYISVMEAALRLAGSVHAFPEGMLTGSYENNNFASALVAEGPFMQGRMAEQAQRKERMREMLIKIIRQGANKRRFAFAGFDTWEKIEQVLTVEVIPSRIIPMDPLKTAQALQIQKQNGWVSDKTCINELGRDIDTETANGLKVGSAEQQAGAARQPGANKQEADEPDLGNVSKEDSSQWLGLSRLQWQRNRKAVTDVLTDYANGKTRRSVATVLLRSIGVPNSDIESILDDASDGQIDSLPESMTEAEKKTLNKPFRTPGGPKKFGVYVKNQKGNVIKLPFGDPKMRIKRNDPGKRRGFRARHNCQDPGPKWKARYWSCRFWSKPSVTKLLKESFQTGEVPWDGRTFVRESWLLRTNPALAYVRLREEKDGDGDGFVNDGKPSERPVNDSDKPKKDASTKKFKTGAEHGFSEMLGPTKRGVKTIGPVDIKGFRVGDTKRPGKKVVHFGGTEQDVKSYQSLHIDAGSTNTEIKQYDISFKNAVLAGHQNDLTRAWFGKPYGEMMDTYQHKYGAKFGASYATAKFDEKLAAEAKKRGHDGIILISPAPPANIEYWDVGGKAPTYSITEPKKESVDNPLVSDDENLTEAFCKTGKGGGVDNSCSSRRKKNASQQNTQAPRVSSPAAAEQKSKKKKVDNQDDIVKRFDIDPGVLFEMSKEDLDAHERALRFNRIRMSQDDYAQLLGKTMIIKATHWKRSDEYQEFQRKLKFIQDGGVDPVTGFEGEQEIARLTKEMEKAKAKFQVWLTGSPDEQKALVQGLRNEHAKGVRNAIKDNREVPDVALLPYLSEKWMPESIRAKFGQGLDSKIESWKSDAVKQSITKYMLGGMIESEKERIVKRDSKFSATRANMLRDLDDIEIQREKLDNERLDNSYQRIDLENQIADAQKAINFKWFKTPDEEQELNRKIDSSKKERDRLLKEYEQNLKAEEEFGYRDRVSEVVKKHLGVENGIKITASLKFDKSISQSAVAKIREKYVAAKKFLESVISDRKSISNPNVKIEVRPDIDRAYYDNQGTVFISPTSSVATIAHEIGHHLEQMSSWPGTMTPTAVRSKALVAAEAGDRLEVHPTFATWSQVKAAIEKDPKNTPKEWYGLEVYAGQKDSHNENNTHRNYARKLYPQEGASEVITMGITRLIESPAFFLVNDSTHFDFVAQWMKGEAD